VIILPGKKQALAQIELNIVHCQTPYMWKEDQVMNPPRGPLKAKASVNHNMQKEKLQLRNQLLV